MKKILSLILALAMTVFILPCMVYAENTTVTRDTVLVLDDSGSMYGEPLEALKTASVNFCQSLLNSSGSNRIALVIYGDSVTYRCDFTNDINVLSAMINNLDANSGTTNITSGVVQADTYLKASNAQIKNMIVMTDGVINVGTTLSSGRYTRSDNTNYRFANSLYDTTTKLFSSYNIYTLGFFHDLGGSTKTFSARVLNDIQNKGYYEVTDPDSLAFIFGEVADDLIPTGFTVIRIACPVDVTLAKGGEVLSSAGAAPSVQASFGTLQFSGAENDVKTLTVDTSADYSLTLRGNGTGTMDYSISFCDENGKTDIRAFNDVPITPTTVIRTSTDKNADTVLYLDADGDGIFEQTITRSGAKVSNARASEAPFVFTSDVAGYSNGWKGLAKELSSMKPGSKLTVALNSNIKVVPRSVIETIAGKDITVTFKSSRFNVTVNGKEFDAPRTLKLR